MKIKLKTEYLLIFGFVLLSLTVVLLGSPLRWVFGLPFVLFLPGYLVVSALLPKAGDLKGSARIAASVGISIIAVPFLGLVLNWVGWGIRLVPLMISLALLDAIFIVPGWYRRDFLSEGDRYAIKINVVSTTWTERTKTNQWIHAGIMLTSLLIGITILHVLLVPHQSVPFTEFYITGLSGKTSGYPEELKAGETGTVRAVIINNEKQETIYRLEIRIDGELSQSESSISLKESARWQQHISFRARNSKGAMNIEFLLYREQDETPYRQLNLWVEVVE